MGKITKAMDTILDMSKAARMKRAKEMGFNEYPVFHGTSREFQQFDPHAIGTYSSIDTKGNISLTPFPEVAKNYATGDAKKVGNKYFTQEYDDELERMVSIEVTPKVMELRYRGKIKEVDAGGRAHDPNWMIEQEKLAQKEGFDGVQYRNFEDSAFYNPLQGSTDTLKIFDPKNLRSVDAAFDPEKSDSANILASYAPVGLLAGATALGLQNRELQAADDEDFTRNQQKILKKVENRLYKNLTTKQKNIVTAARKRQRARQAVQKRKQQEAREKQIAQLDEQLTQGAIKASHLSENQIDEIRRYRESKLPELSGISKNISYPTALTALTATDPYEIAAILKRNDSDLSEITTPDGEVLIHNRRTGAIASLNKPGLSKMDLVQGAGLMGLLGTAALTRGASTQALTGMGLMGAVEGSQAAKGGDFNVSEVLMEGLFPFGASKVAQTAKSFKNWIGN